MVGSYDLQTYSYDFFFSAAAALNNFTFQSPEQIFYTDYSQQINPSKQP